MAFFYGFLGILGTIALFLLKGLVNAWIDWLVSNLMLMLLVISLVGGGFWRSTITSRRPPRNLKIPLDFL